MKQNIRINKTGNSVVITRSVLREELKKFATKNDLKSLATKEELKENLKEIESRFDVKMDFKLENLERRVDEKARQYRDEILTSNDKLAKKLETMQQELGVGNLQMKRQLEDHEERIVILESAQKS